MGEGAVLLLAFLFSKSEIILLNNLSGILVFMISTGTSTIFKSDMPVPNAFKRLAISVRFEFEK